MHEPRPQLNRTYRRHALLVVAMMAALTSASLFASVVVPLTLSQLTREATTIVDGVVADIRAVAGPSGTERLVLLHVSATWKGAPDDTLYVRLPGGRLGRIETFVAGAPLVAEGDRAVWFLDAHPRGGYVVLGLHQGVLRTQPGVDGETLVLAPPRESAGRGDLRRLPRSLSDVAADVRALLRAEAIQ